MKHLNKIINKLNNGEKFALYENGNSCYFADGTKVHYKELWSALRQIHNLESHHSKNLFELCPGNFTGIYAGKFNKMNAIKRFAALFAGGIGTLTGDLHSNISTIRMFENDGFSEQMDKQKLVKSHS